MAWKMTTGRLMMLITAAAIGGSALLLATCDNSAGGQNTSKPKPQEPSKPDTQPPKEQPKDDGKQTKPRIEKVTISSKDFKLELAADPNTRFKGLSDRTEIAGDGGMLFVFPRASVQQFVMRDCPIPIDIIYLNASGRVLASYKMVPEPPRTAEEKVNDPGQSFNRHYEERLKRYSSKFDCQFVIELKGDTLDSLKLKEGDKIDLDLVRLKQLAK
ncbi:hypothetical protein PHYC_01573 [Phycisphaerales bacterium]|nr:hypothetical protein PHYC_01573 [Phycisphaerales bacterium]